MPQKKNAIVPEIFRARTSQIIADIVGAMGIVKALPLSYNLDLQELTRNLWSATDKATSSIAILALLVRHIKFNDRKIGEAVASDEFLFATELADHLVEKFGVPFREAHSRVGKLVKYSVQKGLTRTQFTGIDLNKVNEILDVTLSSQELASIVDPIVVLSKRKATGSPNPKMVLKACKTGEKSVAKHEATLDSFWAAIENSDELLKAAAEKIQGRNRDADVLKRKLQSRMEVKK